MSSEGSGSTRQKGLDVPGGMKADKKNVNAMSGDTKA